MSKYPFSRVPKEEPKQNKIPLSFPGPTALPKSEKDLLIREDDAFDSLVCRRDGLVDELADIEIKRHRSGEDNLERTLILHKLQVIEIELLRRALVSFEKKISKLLGLP